MGKMFPKGASSGYSTWDSVMAKAGLGSAHSKGAKTSSAKMPFPSALSKVTSAL